MAERVNMITIENDSYLFPNQSNCIKLYGPVNAKSGLCSPLKHVLSNNSELFNNSMPISIFTNTKCKSGTFTIETIWQQ